ncbi:Phospholipid phosphatase 3 [Halotydeus destructor]|nr:Phospholipid phosphatase 3 [Halotydeus destructor]
MVVLISNTLALILLVAYSVYKIALDQPEIVGFWCSDGTIKLPYRPLTVNMTVIIFFAYIIPAIVIYARETLTGGHFRSVLRNFYLSATVNMALTLFFKYTSGRLRPHFVDICKPNIDCSDPEYRDRFIVDYICTNDDKRMVRQARLSFFSGHASISLNAAVYLILYLNCLASRSSSMGQTRLIQVAILLLGLYPGLTQISNHWHHWSDVAVGYGAGTLVALLSFKYGE